MIRHIRHIKNATERIRIGWSMSISPWVSPAAYVSIPELIFAKLFGSEPEVLLGSVGLAIVSYVILLVLAYHLGKPRKKKKVK
jgi:hypothetical protein